jgi:hypothetical protein
MAKDPFKAFLSSFKRQRTVSEPIASGTWTFKDYKGKKRRARIEIGRPQPVPHDKQGDWFCPVFIGGYTPHVIPVMGVASVDSLVNAVALLRGFHEAIASLLISHRGSMSTRRPRPLKVKS